MLINLHSVEVVNANYFDNVLHGRAYFHNTCKERDCFMENECVKKNEQYDNKYWFIDFNTSKKSNKIKITGIGYNFEHDGSEYYEEGIQLSQLENKYILSCVHSQYEFGIEHFFSKEVI